jgi:polyphosphate kinase
MAISPQSPPVSPHTARTDPKHMAVTVTEGVDREPTTPDLDDPRLYINRELSLLEFQKRVLEEAQDSTNPLLERVKFLSILSSNLDEFFMVRVAGLITQLASGAREMSIDGQSPSTQLQLIRQRVCELAAAAHDLWKGNLLPALEEAGIRILDSSQLSDEQRSELREYFIRNVFPVLTPLAFDPGRPFPHISTRSLNIAAVVRDKEGEEHFARIKVPGSLPQLIALSGGTPQGGAAGASRFTFVWLEQLVCANLRLLFPGMEIVEAHPFRVTRDAEVAVQELESDDLLETVEEAMLQRRFLHVVRLQVSTSMPDHIVKILTTNLEIGAQEVYEIEEPIGLGRLSQLYGIDRPDLKDKEFVAAIPKRLGGDSDEDIFAVLRREDLLLHHPFESFQPVIDFLRQAARDPSVLAIKMTLYRVGRDSPIVAALLEAVEEGKEVAVLVELKARFDEESNIEWARKLEDAGVHVVYGLVGVKVHSKIALVIRREGDAIRRYVHLGTGNYNPVTARLYTDLGFFTCDEEIGEDATYFFNALTGYSARHEPHRLLVARINLRQGLEELILREIEFQKKGERGHLILKMNALEDPEMMKMLYRASQAGVQVDLLVRGLCCLRPGLPGVSENTRVTSIVGRFLEHSRIYYFRNGGAEEIYVGSADLMRRNLSHRVEILFPVSRANLLSRLKEILDIYLADEAKARFLQRDGEYVRPPNFKSDVAMNSQFWFLTHQDGN